VLLPKIVSFPAFFSHTKYFSLSLELIPSPWRRKVCAFETFMAACRVYRCPNPEDHGLNQNFFFFFTGNKT